MIVLRKIVDSLYLDTIVILLLTNSEVLLGFE